jgi:hypothetical protein
MPYYISPPPQNPIARFIAGIVAVLAIAGAFMIGMVALLVVGGIGLVAGLVIWLRVAWIKRKLMKGGFNSDALKQPGNQSDRQSGRPQDQGQIIDAEYTVVSKQKDPP